MAAAWTALVPWFGAKRSLAPRIVAELGDHACYWEPFCGSMAVLLAKAPAAMETVNHPHGDLVTLARVIADPVNGARLYRRLRRTLCCDTLQIDVSKALAHQGARRPNGARATELLFINGPSHTETR